MGKWPASPDLIEALLRTLHHEEEWAQRAAAEALGVFASSDPAVADQLAHLAETSVRATTRACALEALGLGRIDDPRLVDLTERERRSGSGEIAITAITIRIRKKLQTDDDLHRLLRRAGRTPYRVGFQWRPDLIEALLTGWPRSAKVKAATIKSLKCHRPWEENAIEHEVAFPVLIRGFSGDEDAALALAEFFQQSYVNSNLVYDAKDWLPGHTRWFAEHPVVIGAVETYLFRKEGEDSYRFAQLALLARTPRVKAHLIDTFRQSKNFGLWPAWALIEGWGIEDKEVETVLRAKLDAQPDSIAGVASLIPRIFYDRSEARSRLLRCLNAEKTDWPWLLLSSIVDVDGNLSSPDVLEPCLRLVECGPNPQQKTIRRYLIEHAAPDFRVRELALTELADHDGELSAVAEGFGHDATIRARLIAVISPLP
ncbi:MAG: HEAT repeat domain-containing protein, partial [Verrucomicrobiota bacterium]